jgi:hypothetical protein
VVESKFIDRLWLSFSLALAKPNNIQNFNNIFLILTTDITNLFEIKL